ncbi:apolipoprotein N-acyltransferase [Sulfitobacter undariae]|uniref:apolipoprotein N-acyltransferase n=1 Tax=Sulfitobacter undariae TaxID=1563671 RepID=UPI001FEA957F|nr:apolipoprotein N-acyltransferase [Sulfitobacter undariae]
MSARKRWLILLVLGALAAMGQAPFDLPLVMIVAMAAAVVVFNATASTSRTAAACGFAFGFGYFAVALHWIVSPFLVDAATYGWMAPFAVMFMAAGGAVFWSIGFWAARRLSSGGWALVPCWAGVEVLRAYILTGFPWASPAQAMVNVLPGQSLALIGPHGLNLLIFAVVVGLAGLSGRGWGMRIAALVPVVLLMFIPPMNGKAPLSDTVLRLVQPNAAQKDKWNPDMIRVFYERQLAFTAARPETKKEPDAVIWPETAIPWNLNDSGVVLEEISAAAGGVPVVLGAQRRDGLRYFNALALLGSQGQVLQTYDKHHLVPFGEYMPLGDLAARFGIYGMASQNGAGFTAGPGAQLMDLGPVGRALPLICYEAVFPDDVNAAPTRPDFIIHATNDAWFGPFAGPQQHLAQARMRAIEQGLPVARAANTGISAMIDPYGRVLDRIGMGQAGYLDAALPLPLAPTLYSRTGDVPAVVLLVLLLGALALRNFGVTREIRE